MPGCLTAPGFYHATSSVTASPCHLPLEGEGFWKTLASTVAPLVIPTVGADALGGPLHPVNRPSCSPPLVIPTERSERRDLGTNSHSQEISPLGRSASSVEMTLERSCLHRYPSCHPDRAKRAEGSGNGASCAGDFSARSLRFLGRNDTKGSCLHRSRKGMGEVAFLPWQK